MSISPATGTVRSVCMKEDPGIPKNEVDSIRLLKDLGVEGDYHAGKFVRHRYLAKKDPSRYNNRQVLMIDSFILSELADQGIDLGPGEMGENIILEGIELMSLPIGTRLQVGPAEIELTEIREPCFQLDGVYPGLEQAVEGDVSQGEGPRAGMLGVVSKGGTIKTGQRVVVLE